MTETTATQPPKDPIAKKDNVLSSEGTSNNSTGPTTEAEAMKEVVTTPDPLKKLLEAIDLLTKDNEVLSRQNEHLTNQMKEIRDNAANARKELVTDSGSGLAEAIMKVINEQNRPLTNLEKQLMEEKNNLTEELAKSKENESFTFGLLTQTIYSNDHLKKNERMFKDMTRQANQDKFYFIKKGKRLEIEIEALQAKIKSLKESITKMDEERELLVTRLVDQTKKTNQAMRGFKDNEDWELIPGPDEAEIGHREHLKKCVEMWKEFAGFLSEKVPKMKTVKPKTGKEIQKMLKRIETLPVYKNTKLDSLPWLWNPQNKKTSPQTVSTPPENAEALYNHRMFTKHRTEWADYNGLIVFEQLDWQLLSLQIYQEHHKQVIEGWIRVEATS